LKNTQLLKNVVRNLTASGPLDLDELKSKMREVLDYAPCDNWFKKHTPDAILKKRILRLNPAEREERIRYAQDWFHDNPWARQTDIRKAVKPKYGSVGFDNTVFRTIVKPERNKTMQTTMVELDKRLDVLSATLTAQRVASRNQSKRITALESRVFALEQELKRKGDPPAEILPEIIQPAVVS